MSEDWGSLKICIEAEINWFILDLDLKGFLYIIGWLIRFCIEMFDGRELDGIQFVVVVQGHFKVRVQLNWLFQIQKSVVKLSFCFMEVLLWNLIVLDWY